VKQELNENGFAVTEKDVNTALKMIATGRGNQMRLK
jgi:hypothetical protein